MNIVKNSIVIFFSLGVTFFLLIFLYGVAQNDATLNQVDNSVLIKENEIQRWGTIPGSLNYLWERTYNFYSISGAISSDTSNLQLHKESEITSNVTRTFNDANWAPTVSVVEYYEDYKTNVSEDQLSGDYETFNMGALSIFNQMNSKPDFWLAWKALCQINTIMFNSDLVNRYYAWNAFNYVFYDQEMTFSGVLGNFDSSTQMAVYTDPFYGLDTINKVYYWVLANNAGNTSDDWKKIQDYFVGIGIQMTDEDMEAICGDNSILGYANMAVYDNILKTYNFKVEVDETELIVYQWGQDSFLPNPNITIVPDTPPIYTLKDLNSDVLVPPEFAYYVRGVQNETVSEETFLDTDQCNTVLNAQPEDYRTLLNPQNMEYFYVQYNAKNYIDLKKRFGFDEISQIDSMYSYLEYMRKNQLNFEQYGDGYDYSKNVLGQLIYKYVNVSWGIMNDVLPLEVTARNFAKYNKQTDSTCSTWVSAAVTDADTVAAICDGVDVQNPDQIKLLINGTWYNNDSDLIARGFTSDELTTFYGTTDPTQFGTQLLNQTTQISGVLGCTDSTNCTATEIATLQWKDSFVTLNPVQVDSDYTPVSKTMAMWGTYPTPQLNYDESQTPEFYECNNEMAQLSDEAIGLIVDKKSGFANELFAVQFAEFVSNGDDLDKWATLFGVSDATSLLTQMRYCVQNFLLQGATVTKSKKEILEGYTTNIADKVGGGDFFAGADFDLINDVTPVSNEINGQIGTGKFGVYTGSLGVDEVSTVRRVNNVAYVNKNFQMFNGTYYHDVTLNPGGSSDSFTSFNKCSNGMQFAPNTDSGSVRVYDNSMLKIKTYDYSNDATLDTSDYSFPVTEFSQINEATQSAGFVGDAYNLNYYFYNQGCNGCPADWLSSNTLIDSEAATPSSDSSTNSVTVQGNTGFMTSSQKQGTMYLWFESDGTTSLALPSLDFVKQLVPIFDLNEKITIDSNSFAAQYGFVASSDSSVHGATIAFIVLAILFFIFAIVALVLTKFKGGNNQTTQSSDPQKQPLNAQTGEYNESQGLLDHREE